MMFLSTYVPAINIFKHLITLLLCGLHMDKNYFIGCRVDKDLFNKIDKHVEQNSTLLRKAIEQYFRKEEPNENIFSYDREVIQVLNNRITSLENLNERLQSKLDLYQLQSMGWFKRKFFMKYVKQLPVHK